jgi:hypothetical protein
LFYHKVSTPLERFSLGMCCLLPARHVTHHQAPDAQVSAALACGMRWLRWLQVSAVPKRRRSPHGSSWLTRCVLATVRSAVSTPAPLLGAACTGVGRYGPRHALPPPGCAYLWVRAVLTRHHSPRGTSWLTCFVLATIRSARTVHPGATMRRRMHGYRSLWLDACGASVRIRISTGARRHNAPSLAPWNLHTDPWRVRTCQVRCRCATRRRHREAPYARV